jgi:hypothetical protein
MFYTSIKCLIYNFIGCVMIYGYLWNSPQQTSKEWKLYVAPRANTYLYRNCLNPIEIAIQGYCENTVQLSYSLSNGTVFPNQRIGSLEICPGSGAESVLTISHQNKALGSEKFRRVQKRFVPYP